MKIGYWLCPACFRETLTEVVGGTNIYWRCVNRDCGQTFRPEKVYPIGSDDAISESVGLSEDQLAGSKRYRIPTTIAGQLYELRRMFRR